MKVYTYYPNNSELWDKVERKKLNQGELIKRKGAGEEFQVIHKRSGEDITNQILSSAIFYKHRKSEEFQKKLIQMFFERESELDFMSYEDLFT